MSAEERKTAVLTLLALLFGGLSYLLILPPYEGFDETAHYSYISYLADRHGIPDFRSTPLDTGVESDRAGLPRPYAVDKPYENNGGKTYRDFFLKTEDRDRRAAISHWHAKPPVAARYAPGPAANWQGQHPPLYYALMGVPYRLLRGTAPADRLLLMRAASVAFLLGSALIWFALMRRLRTVAARRMALAAGAAAAFLPGLFHGLIRLGNDSLAALIFAACFYFMWAARSDGRRKKALFSAGLFLGLGLLTKAYFLPAGAAMAFLAFRSEDSRTGTAARLSGTALLLAAAFCVAAGWFYFSLRRYGVLAVSHEEYFFPQAPAPQGALKTALFFLFQLGFFIRTFLWCGTWSWVPRPAEEYALFVPWLALSAYHVFVLRRRPGGEEARALWRAGAVYVLFIIAGFLPHLWSEGLHRGLSAGSGGYYLYFAWPAAALLLSGPFWGSVSRGGKASALISAGALLCFELAGFWRLAQVYSGLIGKDSPLDAALAASVPFAELPSVLERLRELVYPEAAVLCLMAAIALKAVLARRLILKNPL